MLKIPKRTQGIQRNYNKSVLNPLLVPNVITLPCLLVAVLNYNRHGKWKHETGKLPRELKCTDLLWYCRGRSLP